MFGGERERERDEGARETATAAAAEIQRMGGRVTLGRGGESFRGFHAVRRT